MNKPPITKWDILDRDITCKQIHCTQKDNEQQIHARMEILFSNLWYHYVPIGRVPATVFVDGCMHACVRVSADYYLLLSSAADDAAVLLEVLVTYYLLLIYIK